MGSARVSPTAHYTGYVWARHGIGAPELATREGRLAFHGLAPAMAVSRTLGGPDLEGLLLARHRVIDRLLGAAIEAGRIGTVVELAAGMSPRGLSFTRRFPDAVVYVETDLPGMVERKRRALDGLGGTHRVEALDVLRPGALEALLQGLDGGRGVAVVSEGLLNYLPRAAVTGLWARIAAAVGPTLHLSDLHVRGENAGPLERAFTTGLGAVVRGRIHFHFDQAADAGAALHLAGFATATLHRPAAFAGQLPGVDAPGGRKVRVLEAWT